MLVGVTGALVWMLWERNQIELRNAEAHPIAEALQGETEGVEGVWPPVAGGSGRGLAPGSDGSGGAPVSLAGACRGSPLPGTSVSTVQPPSSAT